MPKIPLISGLLVAVSNGAAAQPPGPDLILRDSLVLEETEEHYIGNPLALFVAPDGSLLVSDGFAETVLRYDATGRLTGHLGGRGGGPGEFRHLGGVGFVTESVAGFLDETGRLELFEPMTGAHHGSVRVDVNNRPASFAVWGDSLWFAGNNRVSSASHGADRHRGADGRDRGRRAGAANRSGPWDGACTLQRATCAGGIDVNRFPRRRRA
ncbi:MAG: hypothetical protein OXH66_17010 [Gemmatimonadetes bacterium]|nr:hypothetical protein [Gemmatimonadota bacterium]